MEYIPSWECFRTEAGGVSCYSSEDLLDWKFEGVALAPDTTNPFHGLHPGKVIERPKVIYNDKTGKFVMWLHVDTEDYSYASTGVANSDTPEGPYSYLHGMHPGGQWNRNIFPLPCECKLQELDYVRPASLLISDPSRCLLC